MIKQAIIPLAGMGTRLLPLTSVFPKELLPINGKPGIEYILDECIDAGVSEIIFIYIAAWLRSSSDGKFYSVLFSIRSILYFTFLLILPNFLNFTYQIPFFVFPLSSFISIIIIYPFLKKILNNNGLYFFIFKK